ncbi:hypothetical protein WR25_09244, partial [Diploscapter pachys]
MRSNEESVERKNEVKTRNPQTRDSPVFMQSAVKQEKLSKEMWINDYVVTHYRPPKMPLKMCLKSSLHCTNETVNIWTHALGFLYFSYQQWKLHNYSTFEMGSYQDDRTVFSLVLLGYQICLLLSVTYHIFGCHSEKSRRHFLRLDLFGISAAYISIYLSGIYTAFFCFEVNHKQKIDDLRQFIYRRLQKLVSAHLYFTLTRFYLTCLLAIFCMSASLPICSDLLNRCRLTNRITLLHISYLIIALFGIVPTAHWVILHGGFNNSHVTTWFPDIIVLYSLTGAAFFFYVTMLPERKWPGVFDLFGSSHQCWHTLILGAMIY